MNMNGGTSTSATDPHHHLRAGGYLGLGIPGLGTTPLSPPGNGFGGGGGLSGLGTGGGGVGPELKHHADFLSRLLAATPSYMSEVGNPPPGFFSDWLRRLVSKPGGNGTLDPSVSPPDLSPSPSAIHHQTGQTGSPLTFGPAGQPETNGASHSAQTTPQGKRRKRSRLNDHLHLSQHHHHAQSGKESSSVRDPSSPTSHLNQNSQVSSGLTSTMSGSSGSPASGSLNPFTHPLWFFPPFLPNPYMNMGMNLPGLLPPGPPSSGPAPSYLSSPLPPLSGSEGLLASFRSDSLLHPHLPHHFSQPTDLNLNTVKKEPGAAESKSKKGGKGGKKSSSFSISRLTSPSPSSNSSGGSSGRPAAHPVPMEPTKRSSPSSLATPPRKKREKRGTSESGSEAGSSKREPAGSLCVDLRVSGRIWERSGVPAPPPRSIYKPLSAFHDPSDVNLTHSSSRPSPDRPAAPEQGKMIEGDQAHLSTTYVLKNLSSIYGRVRAGSITRPLSPPRPHELPIHPFNYSDSEDSSLDPVTAPRTIELVVDSLGSPPPSLAPSPAPALKIPLPRPIRVSANYSNGRSPPKDALTESEDNTSQEQVRVLSEEAQRPEEDDKEY